jgi:hypothetical protein
MKTLTLIPFALAALLATAAASARVGEVTDPDRPRALPAEGAVAVRWDDPAAFSEIRGSNNRWEARRGNWVYQIADYLRTRAEKRLAPGERLDVAIHDIRRAGNYEPWRGPNANDIRYVRDIYPPRIALSFTLSDAQGKVIAQGDRKLTDLAFTSNTSTITNSDPLRYEKRLLDDWLRNELRAARI